MNIPLAIKGDTKDYFSFDNTIGVAKSAVGMIGVNKPDGCTYEDIKDQDFVLPDAAKPETYSSPCAFPYEFSRWKIWNLCKNGEGLVFYTTPETQDEFTKTLDSEGIDYGVVPHQGEGVYSVQFDGKKTFDAIAGDDGILSPSDIENLANLDGVPTSVSRADIFTAVYNNPTTNGQSTLGSLSSSASEIFSKGGELFSGSQLLSLGGELLSGLTGLFE